jgi:serine/threonine protein kinase
MEYMPNGTLRDRHPKGSILSIETFLPYVKQAAAALQSASNDTLLRRDIRPEKMFLGQNDNLLLSFGLLGWGDINTAQMMDDRIDSISKNVVTYMTPEQFNGKPKPASDQYSLGIVIYEWLCGRPPFTEGDFIKIGIQHMNGSLPSLRSKNPYIPQAVEDVVMKALAKKPEDRFESTQAFANAFEQACR